MLEVRDLKGGYGRLQILDGVNISINKGEIVSLIGRNGVGKSTFAKTLIGLIPVMGGQICFPEDTDISRKSAYKRAREGMAYVPQGHGIFPLLTVEENLKIGCLINNKKKEENFERVYSYFPRLAERKKQRAGTMSGGEQAMLSIGRVLVNSPELIILDEPTEGVQPNIVEQMGDIILKFASDMGLTVLLIEQHIGLIQQVTERAYVMDKGRILTELTREEVQNDALISQYLSV